MSDEEKQTNETNDSSIYYVLGGVVLVAAVAGFFLLKPKTTKTETVAPTTVATQQPPAAVPTPGPITKLSCDKQYYNPVIGFPRYYLSVEGVDTRATGVVQCTYTVSVNNKVVDTTSATGALVEAPSRGGAEFRCISKAVELARGVATKVEVKLENEANQTATCSQSFIFP